MLRKGLTILFALTCIGSSAWSQKSTIAEQQMLQYFFGGGTTSYFGEVGGADGEASGLLASLDYLGWDPLQTRLGFTAGTRFGIKGNMAMSMSLNPIWISGNDKRSTHADRGYKFNAFALNGSFLYEYYFGTKRIQNTPFLGVGPGLMVFTYKNNVASTFGDPGISPSFVFNLGIRLPSRTRYLHTVQIEFNYLFTDRLDGIEGHREIGDTFYFLKYCMNIEVDKTFVYNKRGLIR